MKGKDLLQGMSYISSCYVEEGDRIFPQKKVSLRRVVTLAAAAALALLLVGCAVVYVLRMQDLKLGEQTRTQEVFSTDGQEFLGYEEVEQQVLTFTGLKGSKNYQAAQEWFTFKQEYDPDQAIQASVWGNFPEYPDDYLAYGVYSDEMVAKLDEIAEKYDLKLMGKPQSFRTATAAMEALGLETVLKETSGAQMDMLNLSCYQGGNFTLTGTLRLPESVWAYPVLVEIDYHDKAYFNHLGVDIDDTGDWQEWNYTTASGNQVLILRSASDWRAWIFCDRPDATVTVLAEAVREVYSDSGVEKTAMTDRQLELLAETIDFSLKPTAISADADFRGEAAIGAATQNGVSVELISAVTDGYVGYVTIGITAPEGTALIDPDIRGYHLVSGNWSDGFLEPVNDSGLYGSMSAQSVDDGDGLANTHNIVITMTPIRDDGTQPIREDSRWNLYFEDLKGSWWNQEKHCEETEIIAEGVWSFDISFAGNDFREIELLQQPVTQRACTGWKIDGTNVYEDVTITSFKLRSLCAVIGCDDPSADFNDRENPVAVVMEDGAEIYLGSDMQVLRADRPIDLDHVDHVRLSDGTILKMP